MTSEDLITVGRSTKAHGVHGELEATPETAFPERFLRRTRYYMQGPRSGWYQVESARMHGGRVLLKLAGVESREQAETLRDHELQVLRATLPALPEGEYYWFQITGLEVVDGDGVLIGLVTQVLQEPANDVYVVQTPKGKEILLPAIKQVIRTIDLEHQQMVVDLMPGLSPEEER